MRGKTVIGVLTSHDNQKVNEDLRDLFQWAYNEQKLDPFHFLFTGGTFDRVVLGTAPANAAAIQGPAQNAVKQNATRLPTFAEGGVTLLANFVVQRQCSVVWSFLSPQTMHWLNPENLALLRLCDAVGVRRFLNATSAKAWLAHEVGPSFRLRPHTIPLPLTVNGRVIANPDQPSGYYAFASPRLELVHRLPWDELNFAEHRALNRNPLGDRTIALIAHDAMKPAMVRFVLAYAYELSQFQRILATESTGRAIVQSVPQLSGKICWCRSGPLGGDIEIATEVLYGQCDVVIFFQDPQHPHPHIEDIRTLLAACARTRGVLMFTNEEHARDWMNAVVRPNC